MVSGFILTYLIYFIQSTRSRPNIRAKTVLEASDDDSMSVKSMARYATLHIYWLGLTQGQVTGIILILVLALASSPSMSKRQNLMMCMSYYLPIDFHSLIWHAASTFPVKTTPGVSRVPEASEGI
jgi:hypothetical protein